ncbi:MAG TPA: trypsin-like peptidase domain-containing protein [Spirochaetia bacterium]|nr:trypsin-like peptidase domain-containing protein [Spirochaetia bacterium]
MKVRLLLTASVAALILSACATTRPAEVPPPDRKSFVETGLNTIIASDTPQNLFPRLSYYLSAGAPFSDSELLQFAKRGIAAVRVRLDSAMADRKYTVALSLVESLDTLAGSSDLPRTEQSAAEAAVGNLTVDRVKLDQAEQYRKQGNSVAALATLLDIGNLAKALTTDELLEYGEIAKGLNDRSAISAIISALTDRNAAVPPDFKTFLSIKPTPAEMLKGTVTIWVNRGIKLQDGIGVPDRVIGSGFFIDPRGYLITNYHVISSEVDPTYQGYSRLFIRLPTQPDLRIPARVIGYSRIFDIALLKVEITPAYVFSFTGPQKFQPGQRIFAMGSPGGLEDTFTSGIISATGRRFLQMGDAIQMDVPVNPGNSGGPLVNGDGNLVGVVFAGIQQFQGVNFAIPSYWVRSFIPELYQGGEVGHPWIGAVVQEVGSGLSVVYVAPGSPAEQVGLKEHDVITGIDGKKAMKIGDMQELLLSHPQHTLLSISWTRNEQDHKGVIATGRRPFSPIEEALKSQEPADLFAPLFGMDVHSTSNLPWQRDFVVTHVYPGSIADETGLSVQDPFSVVNWQVDTQRRAAILQIVVRTRKAGFLEHAIQIASYLEIPNFL